MTPVICFNHKVEKEFNSEPTGFSLNYSTFHFTRKSEPISTQIDLNFLISHVINFAQCFDKGVVTPCRAGNTTSI